MVKHLGEHWITMWDTTIKDENAHYTEWVLVETAQEKCITVYAAATSSPGALSCQLQLSPDMSDTSIVNCGDAVSIAATGADYLAWTVHSKWARLSLTSAATTDTSNYWTINAKLQGK